MSHATFIVGGALTVLRTMPDASVDLVLTSPPFFGLRSYLDADDPAKADEMGSEESPAAFLDALLDVVEECRRVLAPHGSIAIELGDSYSGSGGSGGDYLPGGMREGQAHFGGTAATARSATGQTVSLERDRWASSDARPGWPLAKSLCLTPETFRFALAYGRNPFNGRPTPQWRVRNVVRWVRPNPPVGALADKYRPATSEMVIACTARDRYFDLEAVRTPLTAPGQTQANGGHRRAPERGGGRETNDVIVQNEGGAPPLDWWNISTHGYPGAHYATWPPQLCVIPIQSMCPLRVCTVCGKPSRRIVEATHSEKRIIHAYAKGERTDRKDWNATRPATTTTTTGWTDCGHADSWRTGIVLDPFAGTGTTLAVATGHGRDAIGIDLDRDNAPLAVDRIGPLMCTVVDDRVR